MFPAWFLGTASLYPLILSTLLGMLVVSFGLETLRDIRAVTPVEGSEISARAGRAIKVLTLVQTVGVLLTIVVTIMVYI